MQNYLFCIAGLGSSLNPSVIWRDMMEGENCPICMKKVYFRMYALKCGASHNLVHRNCTLFTINEYDDFIKSGNLDWTCRICIESIFPFNRITDDDVFQNSLVEYFSDCHPFNIDSTQHKIFNPFNLNDEKDYLPCTDIDPDSCYYNDLSVLFKIATTTMKNPSITLYKESSMVMIHFP